METFNDMQQKKMTDDELDQVNGGGTAEILVQKINDIFNISDEIRYTKKCKKITAKKGDFVNFGGVRYFRSYRAIF